MKFPGGLQAPTAFAALRGAAETGPAILKKQKPEHPGG